METSTSSSVPATVIWDVNDRIADLPFWRDAPGGLSLIVPKEGNKEPLDANFDFRGLCQCEIDYLARGHPSVSVRGKCYERVQYSPISVSHTSLDRTTSPPTERRREIDCWNIFYRALK